jgi:hypothetical protein
MRTGAHDAEIGCDIDAYSPESTRQLLDGYCRDV